MKQRALKDPAACRTPLVEAAESQTQTRKWRGFQGPGGGEAVSAQWGQSFSLG